MKRVINISLIVQFILITTSCNYTLMVKSPDKNNTIKLELNDKGTLYYSIQSHGIKAIGKSRMGMDISEDVKYYVSTFNSGLSFVSVNESVIDETYTLPTGKTSTYINKANEAVFILKNKENKELRVICRAYNDGIAFRYVIESPGELTITKENTRFSIPQNTLSWMMNYTPNYENFYPKRLLDTIGTKPLSYPALLQVDNLDKIISRI